MSTSFRVRSIFSYFVDSCDRMKNYLKDLPANENIETKALVAKFVTQNIIMSSFSIDPKCFDVDLSEFNELRRTFFDPTDSGGVILMFMIVCPILIDVLPMP